MINDVKSALSFNKKLSLYSLITNERNNLQNNQEGHLVFNKDTNKINIFINNTWIESNLTIGSNNNLAIGYNAGQTNQGSYTIAIGKNAGQTNQHNNSIVLLEKV